MQLLLLLVKFLTWIQGTIAYLLIPYNKMMEQILHGSITKVVAYNLDDFTKNVEYETTSIKMAYHIYEWFAIGNPSTRKEYVFTRQCNKRIIIEVTLWNNSTFLFPHKKTFKTSDVDTSKKKPKYIYAGIPGYLDITNVVNQYAGSFNGELALIPIELLGMLNLNDTIQSKQCIKAIVCRGIRGIEIVAIDNEALSETIFKDRESIIS